MSQTADRIPTILPADFDGGACRAQEAVRELDAGKTLAANRMVKAGFGPVHTGHVMMARGLKRSTEEHVRAVVDPWLADCPPLPKARVPAWNERGGQ